MRFGFNRKPQKGNLLNDDDILYFLHIPKTAGTTLITLLDMYFDSGSILKLHEWQELLPLMPIDFSKIRFIRGHFGYSIFRILPKKPVCITMLRNPIDLVISSYKMVVRQPKESEMYSVSTTQSISELITDPHRGALTNRQAHHIVADLDVMSMTKGLSKEELKNYFPHHQKEFYLLEMSEQKLFEVAKNRISEDFGFLGLVEKMEESLFLLHYTFGWKPVQNKLRENVAPQNQDAEISRDAMEKLMEMTKVDRKMYDFAGKLFYSRYSEMVSELKEKYYEENYNNMNPNDVVFERLKKNTRNERRKKIWPREKI